MTTPDDAAVDRAAQAKVDALPRYRRYWNKYEPPAPEPEPDVFAQVARWWVTSTVPQDEDGMAQHLADTMRFRFGPLVAELELIAADKRGLDAPRYASAALAQFRARAKEASRG